VKRTERPTDELIQLYALECFLDRLVHSEFADTFISICGITTDSSLGLHRVETIPKVPPFIKSAHWIDPTLTFVPET
jgi:hypothetical protein